MEWVPRWLWRRGFIRAKPAVDTALRDVSRLQGKVYNEIKHREYERKEHTKKIEEIGHRKNLWKQKAKTAEQELQCLRKSISQQVTHESQKP